MSEELNPLVTYLIQQEYIKDASLPSQQINNEVLQIIKVQNEDLMKLRSQNLQLKKSMKELQQKISVQSSNNNNTESAFMMSSEFKTNFQQFISKTIPLPLSPLLTNPAKYYAAFSTILKTYYADFQQQLDNIVLIIAKALKIEGQEKQLFKNILKIIQDNHDKIFIIDYKKYFQLWSKIDAEIDIEQDSQDFNKMVKDYHQLVVYMLLQEEKWEIVYGELKQIEFNKKEHTCVDGYIKQKQVLLLIEGLRKNNTMHPNLKNYVIPMPKNYIAKPIELPLAIAQPDEVTEEERKVEEKQQRIKTAVEQPIKTIGDRSFEISLQLERRFRKTSVCNIPVKLTTIGKIVKQSAKLNTERKVEVETNKIKVQKKPEKQNLSSNANSSKLTNYKQMIKKKFIKEDNRSMIRSKERLMGMYDSSMPSKTERTQKQREGSSQHRKKKEENRPLKPTEEHIAKFRSKHKLL